MRGWSSQGLFEALEMLIGNGYWSSTYEFEVLEVLGVQLGNEEYVVYCGE